MNIGVIGVNKQSLGLIDFLKQNNHVSIYETKKKLTRNGIDVVDGVTWSDPEHMVKNVDIIFICELTDENDYTDLENSILGVGNWAFVHEQRTIVVIVSVVELGGFEKHIEKFSGSNVSLIFAPAPNLNPFSYAEILYYATDNLSKIIFNELINKYKKLPSWCSIKMLEMVSFLNTELTEAERQNFCQLANTAYQLT